MGIAFFAGAALVTSTSWWVQQDPPPVSGQTAADGTSTFTTAGIEYVEHIRVAIVKLNDDALPAGDLGLPSDGKTRITPTTPVELRILGTAGSVVIDLSRDFTLITEDDRVIAIEAEHWGSGTYLDEFADLRDMAANIGWTDADLQRLQDDLTADQRAGADSADDDNANDTDGNDSDGDGSDSDGDRNNESYSATLDPATAIGAAVSATLTISGATTNTTFIVKRL